MTRYTVAYSEYVAGIAEVRLLARRAAAIERSRQALRFGKDIDALCRASMVLLCSHIEGYVKELGEGVLNAAYNKAVCRSKINNEVFYYLSKDRIQKIKSNEKPDKIADAVFEFISMESQNWQKTGGFPTPIDGEKFSFGFASPKVGKIDKYLKRFGYKTMKGDVASRLRSRARYIVGDIDNIVDVRNLIAHGEASATRTPREVNEHVVSALLFCRAVDEGFANWCTRNLCSIR